MNYICDHKTTATMKAILTLKKGAFSGWFGQTFEVCDIHAQGRISLKIGEDTVDFGFHEVLICNFQDELQSAYNSLAFPMPSAPTPVHVYRALHNYKISREIKFMAI